MNVLKHGLQQIEFTVDTVNNPLGVATIRGDWFKLQSPYLTHLDTFGFHPSIYKQIALLPILTNLIVSELPLTVTGYLDELKHMPTLRLLNLSGLKCHNQLINPFPDIMGRVQKLVNLTSLDIGARAQSFEHVLTIDCVRSLGYLPRLTALSINETRINVDAFERLPMILRQLLVFGVYTSEQLMDVRLLRLSDSDTKVPLTTTISKFRRLTTLSVNLGTSISDQDIKDMIEPMEHLRYVSTNPRQKRKILKWFPHRISNNERETRTAIHHPFF